MSLKSKLQNYLENILILKFGAKILFTKQETFVQCNSSIDDQNIEAKMNRRKNEKYELVSHCHLKYMESGGTKRGSSISRKKTICV